MSGCTVIPDSAVQEILISQSKDETLEFLEVIRQCLTEYAVGDERQYQPKSNVVVRPGGQRTLFRPFTAQSNVGCKIIVDPAPDSHGKKPPLHGVLVLTDDTGLQTGVINAEEVTGYRTSLASMIPFMVRDKTKNVVVFGAGKQALWHSRLALVLRGDEIEKLTIVNRSAESGEALLQKVKADNDRRWKTKVQFAGLYSGDPHFDEHLTKCLAGADVVFCTVPSSTPLFEAKHIKERRSAGGSQPLITAIGSWQPDMIEIDTELVKHAVHHAEGQGVLLVDDRDGCLDHAGEVVQSQLKAEQLVEIGDVLGAGQRTGDSASGQTGSAAFQQWLQTGLVIYKSVGVSVMDLTSGQRLLTLAEEKNLGTTLADF